MILEVLTYIREMVEGSDANLLEVVPVPHPGQHQDLGGTYGPSREDNLLAGQVGLHTTKPGDLRTHQVTMEMCWLYMLVVRISD